MRFPADDKFARLVAEASPDGLLVTEATGCIVYVNPAAARMFGAEPEALVGQPVERLVPAAQREAHRSHMQRYAADPRPRPMGSMTVPAVRADGSTFPADVSLSPLPTPAGLYIVASVRDVSERERTSEALRRSERYLRAFISHAPEPVFVADRAGRFTDVNQAACNLLGYTRDELLGKTIAEVLPAADVPRLAMTRQRLLQAGQVEFAEWTLLRKDQTPVCVEINASILEDGRWQAFVRDISTRKRAEAVLRDSEASLRRAQRVAGLGSWDWNLEANTVTRSEELYAIYGITPGASEQAPFAFANLIPDEDRRRVFEALGEALRTHRPYSTEHRVIRPNGDERVCLSQGEIVVRDGRAVRCIGTTLDITELRRAERGRERALGELKAVLEQCPVGITILRGKDAEHLDSNRQAREIQGNALEPGAGLEQLEGFLLDAEGRALRASQLPGFRALQGEVVAPVELLFKRKGADTPPLPIEVSAAPVRDASGEVVGAVVVSRDVTQSKQLEQLRVEWNSVVAHDLRQPINNIALYAALLARRGAELPERARAQVAEIKSEAARLSRMTRDLLDLSRLDASRLRLELSPLDLTFCVKTCVERAALEHEGRRIELALEGPAPWISGDRDRIMQVLENLLSNAIKYGAADAPIRVRVESDGAKVTVSVSNEGDGISPEAQAQLFHRFQRASNAKKGVAGIGLGLQITRGLVEAHGGRISVESAASGTTTFRFVLPVLSAEPAPARAELG